jgi:hypothetical protein
MSFHFCADGVAVLGTVWIPAAQSKLQSSAGACVDGNRTALIVEIHGKQDREQRRYLKACLPMGTMAANCKNTEHAAVF